MLRIHARKKDEKNFRPRPLFVKFAGSGYKFTGIETPSQVFYSEFYKLFFLFALNVNRGGREKLLNQTYILRSFIFYLLVFK